MINRPKPLLCVEHIEKYYGNQGSVTKALNQVSFCVQHGEFVSIMGASGSGKTTLLNCISTIDTVSAGHILLDGKDITTINEDDISAFRRDNLGFVFQDFNLLDTLTLEENIALPLTIGKVSPKEITERINHIAQRLQISDTLKKFPFQVSGGQKQRCAFADDLERMSHGMDTLIGEKGVSVSGGQKQRISLARAFLRDADLLLLDDSLSAVDAKTEQAIIDTIQKERKDKTTIIVSHRLSAVHQADWIIVLDQGQIVEEGRASDLLAQEGWYYEQYQRQQKQEGE